MIHDEVGMPKEAMDSIVKIDAYIVFIFLEAEVAEVEVFEPMVIEFDCDCSLNNKVITRSSDSIILQSSSQHDQL